MAETIAAKPTEFKGVLYRSRLEATWAVCLHSRFSTRNYKITYEPPDLGISDYTPDFKVTSHVCRDVFDKPELDTSWYLEVKPDWPNAEYIYKLRRAAEHTAKIGSLLVLGVGSFYEDRVPWIVFYPFVSECHLSRLRLDWFTERCYPAPNWMENSHVLAAKNHRWDLE